MSSLGTEDEGLEGGRNDPGWKGESLDAQMGEPTIFALFGERRLDRLRVQEEDEVMFWD
jgi:hypothetical protein